MKPNERPESGQPRTQDAPLFEVPQQRSPVVTPVVPFEYDDVQMPQTSPETARRDWTRFFKEYRPHPARLRQWVLKLHQDGQHQTVIGCLQAAMIQGQTQPWMYEVLALSMEIEGAPREAIERVVLSLSDFGGVTFDNLMYSAAYLQRFERTHAALKLYQQASRLAPERDEPYVLGLPLSRKLEHRQAIQWAAAGILQHHWGKDYEAQHRKADDAFAALIREQQMAGQDSAVEEVKRSWQASRQRDVQVRVEWSGDGDVDLFVEEPPGSVCSHETPLTIAGGIHLHDGMGPDQDNCYESYVCPHAVSGNYRVRLKHAFGKIVGQRATVTVTLHAGSPNEEKLTRTIVLQDGEGGFTFELVDGRRTQPRELSALLASDSLLLVESPQTRRPPSRISDRQLRVLGDFDGDRLRGNRNRPTGASTFAPVVNVVPEGTTLGARAVVSGDRRYVRMALNPQFSRISNVFTFSFLNGNGGQAGQRANGN